MKRPLVSVLVFFAIFFAMDRALGAVLASAFARIDSGERGGVVNHVLRQTDAEIVVFGSSRAVYHIDPEVLSGRLGMSAYNAGSPGTDIIYARGVEALLLARGSQAKVFVLHVDPRNLWEYDPAWVQRLAPFYGEVPALDALLDATSALAPLKYQLHTYRYNSLLLSILARQVRPGSPGNGFRKMPADRPQDLRQRVEPDLEDPGPVDPYMEQVYVDFMEAAADRGIQVLMVDGPRWRPKGMTGATRFGRAHLARLAAENGVVFLEIDEFTDPVFLDSDHFADVAHLNAGGARIFSEILAERLATVVEPGPAASAY
ncbi:MAG: hypothetical protein ACQGVK_23215 [Myxococcota bacterium]